MSIFEIDSHLLSKFYATIAKTPAIRPIKATILPKAMLASNPDALDVAELVAEARAEAELAIALVADAMTLEILDPTEDTGEATSGATEETIVKLEMKCFGTYTRRCDGVGGAGSSRAFTCGGLTSFIVS